MNIYNYYAQLFFQMGGKLLGFSSYQFKIENCSGEKAHVLHGYIFKPESWFTKVCSNKYFQPLIKWRFALLKNENNQLILVKIKALSASLRLNGKILKGYTQQELTSMVISHNASAKKLVENGLKHLEIVKLVEELKKNSFLKANEVEIVLKTSSLFYKSLKNLKDILSPEVIVKLSKIYSNSDSRKRILNTIFFIGKKIIDVTSSSHIHVQGIRKKTYSFIISSKKEIFIRGLGRTEFLGKGAYKKVWNCLNIQNLVVHAWASVEENTDINQSFDELGVSSFNESDSILYSDEQDEELKSFIELEKARKANSGRMDSHITDKFDDTFVQNNDFESLKQTNNNGKQESLKFKSNKSNSCFKEKSKLNSKLFFSSKKHEFESIKVDASDKFMNISPIKGINKKAKFKITDQDDVSYVNETMIGHNFEEALYDTSKKINLKKDKTIQDKPSKKTGENKNENKEDDVLTPLQEADIVENFNKLGVRYIAPAYKIVIPINETDCLTKCVLIQTKLESAKSIKNIKEILKVIYHVAVALSDIHQLGYVHRDVKPANISIGSEKQGLLTDFGITRKKNLISLSGSPAYMPPEAIRRLDNGNIMPKVYILQPSFDSFSLGATLFHMIMGHVLIENEKNFFEASLQAEIDATIIEAMECIEAGKIKKITTPEDIELAIKVLNICRGLLVIKVNEDLDKDPNKEIDSFDLQSFDRYRLTCKWAAAQFNHLLT